MINPARGKGPGARASGWLAAVALVACGTPAAAAGVRLSPTVQQHLGVHTTRLAAVRLSTEVDAFAKVLDPGPLAQLVSDLETAEAASRASAAEAQRSAALHRSDDGVSAKDAETAEAQARSDSVRVALLRNRLGLEWGPGVAGMPRRRLDQLVRDIARGRAALVHVDTHNNDGQDGARRVRIDIGAGSADGRVIGPARVAEPRLQSSGLIVEVTGDPAVLLSVGLTQSAHIESQSPLAGVMVPRASVIRFRGSDWVYVRTGPDVFERRLVTGPVPDARGLFVAQGLAPGDEVVDAGAAAVFAADVNSAADGR